MLLFFPLLPCCLPLAAALSRRATSFDEDLHAYSLLGSHFGEVDIPATYDYIVVGGGTAGLTVANRLSKSYSVAVVEAGGFYEIQNANFTEVPNNDVYYLGKNPLWNNPLIDWLQYTTPQSGLNNEKVLFSQGHTLGGGSARNFMWYQRGPTSTYAYWANITGDDGWKFENFDPFMMKSVNFTPPTPGQYPAGETPLFTLADYDPKGGPLQVSYPEFLAPSGAAIGKGLTAIGLAQKPGMTNGDLLGWTNCANTIDPTTETRSSSETSMLRDAMQNKNFNLQIYTQALAKKILFSSNKQATGVQVQVSGTGSGSVTFQLKANKEVIVSAGALRSPQLLMASGVGPSDTLKANGISVVSALKGVGQNMWDHIWVPITREVDVLTAAYLADPTFAQQAQTEYINDRTGIYTNPAGTLIAFEKLPQRLLSKNTYNDLENTFGSDWPHVEYFSQDAYSSTNDDYLLQAPDVRNYTAMSATVVAPFSRGNVTITSKDTADHPVVNPAWLTDSRDMEVLVAGFKRLRELFNTTQVKKILVGNEVYPGKNVTTDAEIEAVIRASADTVFHPAGTCRMGKKSDAMAVLDSKARVLGVTGLRVVDASAFPALPAGHPQGTVYGFAEKIAANILNPSS